MKIAIYPGTFDPITNGHIDVLKKASKLFDKIILAVADITGKKTIFTLEERTELCRKSLSEFPRVEVINFSGLAADLAIKVNACAMIRGLRAVSDFEYELSLDLMNKKLQPGINTIFFVPDNQYLYLSSTMIKQVVELGGDIKDLIPPCVEEALKNKYNK